METNQNDAGNETDARPVLTAALGYAAKGWSVMPLNGKVPVTKHGFKDATTDPDGIKTWWADCPNANVGIVTGKRSGLIVLDIDPRHGGDESLREIMEECGSFSETVVCETGGGGLHFYFRCSEEDMRGRTGILPGIDVKAEGGYVVAPPSIHPETQEAYRWKEGQGPDAVPVADVPPCLMDLINGTPAAAAKESGWNELGTIPKGKRHTVLVSLAGTMRNRGMGEEAIFQALWVENESKCTPPLPEAEIRGISQSIAKYPPGSRFGDDGPNPGALDIFANLWEDTEVFRDKLGSVYATIQQNGFRKTLPIHSAEVKGYLQYKYYALCEDYISQQAMQPFLQTLETKARIEGPTHEVFTRIG
ncbi:MAG TPA: bifunctional DNA primase/polymerase, partial [bacterium]|nr:bifunctional DNA primase/polymerase [bacterium]